MNAADLLKFLAPMRRRIALMVERAVVHLVNDALKLQGLQIGVLADEERDSVERYQEYGFTSHPKSGAEAIVVALGGTRNRAVVIAVDDRRFRLTGLEEGEVAMYTDEGDKIHFKRGGTIEIVSSTEVKVTTPLVRLVAATKVRMETPLAEVTGNVTVTGNLAVAGTVTNNGTNIGRTHVHGGVQSGASNTAGPQ